MYKIYTHLSYHLSFRQYKKMKIVSNCHETLWGGYSCLTFTIQASMMLSLALPQKRNCVQSLEKPPNFLHSWLCWSSCGTPTPLGALSPSPISSTEVSKLHQQFGCRCRHLYESGAGWSFSEHSHSRLDLDPPHICGRYVALLHVSPEQWQRGHS